MRVDIAGNLAGGHFHPLGQGELGQQLRNFWADHVRAKDFAVLRIADDLGETGVFAEAKRLAVGGEGEFPDLDLESGFSGCFFPCCLGQSI